MLGEITAFYAVQISGMRFLTTKKKITVLSCCLFFEESSILDVWLNSESISDFIGCKLAISNLIFLLFK